MGKGWGFIWDVEYAVLGKDCKVNGDILIGLEGLDLEEHLEVWICF